MKNTDESVAIAMDTQNTAIVSFLPYILQDFWEMGTPPRVVIELIRKHCKSSKLSVLDLGCGKGAVSVQVAVALGYTCYGIDCMPEFIETAKSKARTYGVDAYCRFEVGDIRNQIEELGAFDVIILGSIGPVFGNYYQTLSILSRHLLPEGIIIVDDAYTMDSNSLDEPENPVYSWVLSRQEVVSQTRQAGMEILDEVTGK